MYEWCTPEAMRHPALHEVGVWDKPRIFDGAIVPARADRGQSARRLRGGDSATVGPSQGHITSSRALREPGIGRNIIPPSLWRLAGTASVLTFRQDYEHDIDSSSSAFRETHLARRTGHCPQLTRNKVYRHVH